MAQRRMGGGGGGGGAGGGGGGGVPLTWQVHGRKPLLRKERTVFKRPGDGIDRRSVSVLVHFRSSTFSTVP